MLLFGNLVSMTDIIPTGKGAHQHDEGGFGQVEIGDHGVHHAKW